MLNYVLAALVLGRLLLLHKSQCHLTTTRHRRRRAPARAIRGRCRPTTIYEPPQAKRRGHGLQMARLSRERSHSQLPRTRHRR